jgi:hypothetical protein
MYEIIVILKALTEIAGVAFLGQGVLWVIAGSKREQNLVYKLFKTLTSPVTRVTRAITPRVIIDAHIGLVAFFLLMVLWIGLTIMKVKIVLESAATAS